MKPKTAAVKLHYKEKLICNIIAVEQWSQKLPITGALYILKESLGELQNVSIYVEWHRSEQMVATYKVLMKPLDSSKHTLFLCSEAHFVPQQSEEQKLMEIWWRVSSRSVRISNVQLFHVNNSGWKEDLFWMEQRILGRFGGDKTVN